MWCVRTDGSGPRGSGLTRGQGGVPSRSSSSSGSEERSGALRRRVSRAAKLEVELEAVGAEAPAADRRLLPSPEKAPQAEAAKGSGRGERGEGRLRWFITGALCAAFLGLVRAGLETPSPSLRPRRRRCCSSTLGFGFVGVAVGLWGSSWLCDQRLLQADWGTSIACWGSNPCPSVRPPGRPCKRETPYPLVLSLRPPALRVSPASVPVSANVNSLGAGCCTICSLSLVI